MVGKEDLPNAIALNSSIFNGARVVGPAIAGFAHCLDRSRLVFFPERREFSGGDWGAAGDAPCRNGNRRSESGSPFQSFMQGFRFAMSDLPIRSTLLLLSVLSLLGLQYSVFLPIFASDSLASRTQKDSGLLMSAAGVGAVLGALQFAARTSYKGLARWIAATSMTCSVGLMIFSQSKVFWLSMAVLFVVGFCATVADGGDEYDCAEPRAG